MSSLNNAAGKCIGWQFRLVFTNGRRSAWSHVLDLPLTWKTGDAYPTDRDTKFEVRKVIADAVLASGVAACPAPRLLVPCELPQHAGLWMAEDGTLYKLAHGVRAEDKWDMLARAGHLSPEVAGAAREVASGVEIAPDQTFSRQTPTSNDK